MNPALPAAWTSAPLPAVFTVAGEVAARVAAVAPALDAWGRFRGLMGRPPPGPDWGLFLAPCAAVHTLFMRFALDLVFVARDLRVVRVVPGLRPWRAAGGGLAAWGVLEMQAGWFPCGRLAPGARLELCGPEQTLPR